MSEPVILVCGFGRCGSSLVMQMLEAGGMPCTGRWPAFEPDQTNLASFDGAWIAAQHGAAVKVLDPQRPEAAFQHGTYRTIWLDRNAKQRALSQAKFSKAVIGLRWSRSQIRALAASYRSDRSVALAKLSGLGSVTRCRFEDLITEPDRTAERIAIYLGLDDARAMAAVVRPRGTDCYPGMLEVELIEKRESA